MLGQEVPLLEREAINKGVFKNTTSQNWAGP
jgi:hypothetical protein